LGPREVVLTGKRGFQHRQQAALRSSASSTQRPPSSSPEMLGRLPGAFSAPGPAASIRILTGTFWLRPSTPLSSAPIIVRRPGGACRSILEGACRGRDCADWARTPSASEPGCLGEGEPACRVPRRLLGPGRVSRPPAGLPPGSLAPAWTRLVSCRTACGAMSPPSLPSKVLWPPSGSQIPVLQDPFPGPASASLGATANTGHTP